LVREKMRGNICYSGITGTDQATWVLGGTFLKNVYVSLSTYTIFSKLLDSSTHLICHNCSRRYLIEKKIE